MQHLLQGIPWGIYGEYSGSETGLSSSSLLSTVGIIPLIFHISIRNIDHIA
jgi:hypothetical protein